MDFEQALEYTYTRDVGLRPKNLEVMTELLSRLGSPHKTLRAVHIAGTNGKGSVTTIMSNIFIAAGYKTGSFISPFVVEFCERIQVDGKYISKDDYARIVTKIKDTADNLPISFFEVMTAAAFIYFKEQSCDVVCLETGMGGRLDATNTLISPLVCVITAIGMDHSEILGDTVEKIATEKAGIIKQNVPTVVYPKLTDSVLEVILQSAAEKNSKVIVPSASGAQNIETSPTETYFEYGALKIRTPLLGAHQVQNGIVAIEAIEVCKTKGYNIENTDIISGFSRAGFAGRMEVISKKPTVTIDGAHNVLGAKALADYVRTLSGEKLVGVMAMISTKDYRGVIDVMAPLLDCVVVTEINNPKTFPKEKLGKALENMGVDIVYNQSSAEALETAKSLADENGNVIVFGSLYLASEVRE